MLSDFITFESMGNFSLLLIIVVTSTEFTKKIIDKIKRNYKKKWKVESEYIVFLYALLLSILSSYRNYKLNNLNHHIFVSVILVLLNTIVISYIATASYDKIIKGHEDRKLEENNLDN